LLVELFEIIDMLDTMPTSKKRILIVEDDPLTLKVYSTVLTSSGFIVDTAEEGMMGLEKIKEGGFDLILLDAMLPKMDGLTILAKIREVPPVKPNGPIVLTTNLAGEELQKQALTQGAIACLRKTDLSPEQLLDEVKRYLEMSQSSR
jgi:CheY-like chemotaxis protein